VDAWVLDNSVGNVFNDTAQQNGLVNVARNQYDGQDRLVLATAPEGGSVGYIYSNDLKHNIIQVTQTPKPDSPLAPLVTAYTYDPTCNKPTSITDPRGLQRLQHRSPVERSVIISRGDFAGELATDCAALHPGYDCARAQRRAGSQGEQRWPRSAGSTPRASPSRFRTTPTW
jgi:hypothetical protein